jgi:sugar phosphate isomerase/epimerase
MNAPHTRREFLHAALAMTGAMACASASGDQPAADASPSALPLALSSVMFSELTVEEFCAKASGLGFAAMDLWCPFDRCRHLESAAQSGASSFKALLTKYNLRRVSFTVFRTGVWNAGFPAYARFIGECGGGTVVREAEYGRFETNELAAKMKAFFEKLKPEIELAAANGCVLAVENHGNGLLSTLDSLKAFTDINPDPKLVGIALAPFHLQATQASVEEAIRICASQLRFFYAWQHAEGTDQMPGLGATDFVPWLKALTTTHFSGLMSPFMHGGPPPAEMTQLVTRSVRYLKLCASKA